jgi:formylglycine-generating enzyme required for sulfatase activity
LEYGRTYFGRNREAAELLRLVRLAPLTALYGKSGLGKSSLLQAGLFPLLREQHYLPFYLHIDFSDEAPAPPLVQIADRVEEELARAEAEFPQRAPDEGLWDYLHRNDMEIWSRDNFPLTLLLVFDQFEELFFRGAGEGKWVQQVRDSLADLIENRIPPELAGDAAKPIRSQLNLLSQRYRVILSFREDYLPELKAWEKDVPSLLRNYLRLEPLTRDCAIEAVQGPGHAVLDPNVASAIVDFVGNIARRGRTNGEAIIEPVLLSLCCYQFNRQRKPGGKIDKALVESAGEDILNSYYEGALADPEVRVGPDVRKFIETYLIQGDRFRGNYPRQEAIEGKLLNQTQLDALTDRHRLLRVVQYQDTARIELINDRLVEVACKFRDEMLAREKLAEQERQAAQRARRLKWRAGAIIAGFAIVLAIVGYLYIDLLIRTRSLAYWVTKFLGHQLAAAEIARLKPGDAFRECAKAFSGDRRHDRKHVSKYCPDMVVIPAGSYKMGDERNSRIITIKTPFAVSRFAITFDQWDACVAGGGCENNISPSDKAWGRGSRPVINADWRDAQDYVAWLNYMTGNSSYRLLSEAEWEYATRGATRAQAPHPDYPWGNEIGRGHANCIGCGSQWDNKQTAPVGSFEPNSFGLYDMVGNVWQWVEDCYHQDYNGAPTDGSAWTTGDCNVHEVRGGSWDNDPEDLRSANRSRFTTGDRYFDLGFRVGRTLLPP